MTIGKKKIRELLAIAKDARDSATMKQALFDGGIAETDRIKAVTELYRETWIIAPLDRIISELEASL